MPRNKAVILIIAAVISQRAGMERAIANGVSGVCLLEENYRENTVSVGLSRKSDIPGLPQKQSTASEQESAWPLSKRV